MSTRREEAIATGERPGTDEEAFAAIDRARRARHRGILAWIVVGCLLLGAAGFAFIRWLASQPPGTIKG